MIRNGICTPYQEETKINISLQIYFLKKLNFSTTKTKKETKVPMPRTINAKTQELNEWIKVMFRSPK